MNTRFIKNLFDIESEKIKNNKYGVPGERFPTTREIADKTGVSLVTAQKLMVAFANNGLIELKGKKYYLTHGLVHKNTEYGKTIRTTRMLGMHISNLKSPFFANLAREVEVNAKNAGYSLLISSSSYNYDDEKASLDMFRSLGVDGVISCPGSSAEVQEIYSAYPIPVIFLGKSVNGVKTESILVNNYPAAKKVAAHLYETGCRDFIYIGLDRLSDTDDIRLAGFRDGLNQLGYRFQDENIIRIKTEASNGLNPYLKNRIDRINEKTGIFCYHDLIAIDLLNHCAKKNIQVPDIVSVAGFDNLPASETATPQLTTIGYKINEMARMAVMLLVDKIKNDRIPDDTKYYVEPILMIRSSTKNIKNK